jgi:hypothetical protein
LCQGGIYGETYNRRCADIPAQHLRASLEQTQTQIANQKPMV